MKKKVAFIIIFLFLFSLLFSQENRDSIFKIFKKEIQSEKIILNFEISKNSYVKLKVFGFGKKKLKLKSYNVEPLGKNIFKLTLKFSGKKKIFKFYKEYSFYLWQGKSRVVFLTKNGKKSFHLPPVSYKIQRTQSGYRILKQPITARITLPVENGKIYLYVKRVLIY